MNYEVYLDDKILYYPNDETFVILNSQLNLALNEAGSFEFDVPEYNLRFDDFKLRKSMIKVLQNGNEIFYGEVREVTQNFDFTKHVYCVGELAFLFDSIQPQKVYQGSPYDMLKSMIDIHNTQVEAKKAFKIGQVAVKDNYVYHFTNREDTLSAIREKLCNTLDCYIKITKTNGNRYVNLVELSAYGTYCRQEIQFGENLINYSQNMSAQDIATSVIPLGVRLEDDNRTKDAVQGLDEYLTIIGTSTDIYHKNKNDDFVQIDSAIATFGNVRVVKHWDNVTIASNLKDKAVEWLKSAQYEKMTLELTALDQNILDINIDSFDVGDTVHVWALPFGMDTTFPVQKKVIYINDLSKNTVTLGATFQKSYTSQASDAVNKALDEIPEISPILQSAKLNALAQMLDETQGGHVIFEYKLDNDGQPLYIDAISLCNAETIEKSTKRWRWSAGAFGYMKRNSATDTSGNQMPWTDVGVAMTANGQIVADFITTGTMQANRIKGGTLTLGGNGNGNGVASVLNSSGTEKVKLDSSGITATAGSIAGWNIGSGALYKNTTSLTDSNKGVYLGTDGIRSNGSRGAYWYVKDGLMNTNGAIAGNQITGSNLYSKGAYQTNNENGALIQGTTATFAFTDKLGTAHALGFNNGILTYYGHN